MVLPVGPGIDQPDRREIAVADEEILRAKRRAMRQVERELSDASRSPDPRALRLVEAGRLPLARRKRLWRRLVARHVPEPLPEIGRGGNDGQRARHPDQHVHQVMQPEPKPELGQHEPRQHDLREACWPC